MVENLTESLKHTPWLLWLSVAAVAMVSESVERGGWLGRVGIGLIAGGVVALALPGLWWAQWLAAVLVSVAAFLLPRPHRG